MGRIVAFQTSKLKMKTILLHFLTQCMTLLFLIGTVYGVLGDGSFPGTEVFALVLLAVASYAGGQIVKLIRMPPLLGMLLVGLIFRNVPQIPYSKDITKSSASTLRDLSLVVILLKAGLGLDPQKLKKLKMSIFKLSFVPSISEAVASAVCSHFLLDLPWLWSFMLGFILCAVSAAVLVPGMLNLEKQGHGTRSGVPTLVMASVSLDNIVALTGFYIFMSTLTSNESLVLTMIKRPLEPLLGCGLGAALGVLLWLIPSSNGSTKDLVYYKSLLLCLGGSTFIFFSKRVGWSGCGALGCVSLAFISSVSWRKDKDEFESIKWITGTLWMLIEPFLFGLIGAEVTFADLHYNLANGILCLVLGLCFRCFFTIISLLGSSFSKKEKIFISVSWLSKATVQAAVGSQALDYARSNNQDVDFQNYSKQVLAMSVLSIILTAPLGAAFMDIFGTRLLAATEIDEENKEHGGKCTNNVDYGTMNTIHKSERDNKK